MTKSPVPPPPWEASEPLPDAPSPNPEPAVIDTDCLLDHLRTIWEETGELDHVILPREVDSLGLSRAAVSTNLALALAIADLPQEN